MTESGRVQTNVIDEKKPFYVLTSCFCWNLFEFINIDILLTVILLFKERSHLDNFVDKLCLSLLGEMIRDTFLLICTANGASLAGVDSLVALIVISLV